MANINKRINSGFSFILLGLIASNIIGIVFQPILVRLLGTAKYGELATVLAVFGIMSNITLLGMQNSIRKHITQYDDKLDEIASFSILLVSGLGVVSILGGYLILSLTPVKGFLGQELSYLLILSLPALLTTNVFQGFRSILFGLYSENSGVLLKITKKLLYPIIAIGLMLLGFEIRGVLYALILSSLIAGILGYFFTRKNVNFSVENFLKGYRNHGEEVTSYGSLFLFSLFFAQLHYQADILLLRFFEGEAATGVYKGVLVVVQFLWIAPKAIQQTMLHNVSDLFSEGRIEKIEKITNNLTRYTIVILILLGSGLAVLSKPFLTIYYGKEYVSGVLPLQILILGVVLMGMARLITPLAQGTNYLKQSIYITGTASSINIVLNLLLIPQFGITGASIATSFSYGSLVFMYAFLIRRKLDISVFYGLEFSKHFVSFVILLSTLIGLSSLLSGSIVKLLVIPPIGFLVYSFVVFKLDIIGVDEVFDLAEDTPLCEFKIIEKVLKKLRILLKRIL